MSGISIFFMLAELAGRIAFRKSPLQGTIREGIGIMKDLSSVAVTSNQDPDVQRIKRYIRGWERITRERRQMKK